MARVRYGSGAVASAFAVVGRAPDAPNALGAGAGGASFTLGRIQQTARVLERLAARAPCGVSAFASAMDLRASRYGTAGYEPSGSVGDLFPGTYYLASVDELHRRAYGRLAPSL